MLSSRSSEITGQAVLCPIFLLLKNGAEYVFFFFLFCSHPIYYLRPSFYMSLPVVTQIRSHISVSSLPSSLRFVPNIFMENIVQLFSSLVDLRQTLRTHAVNRRSHPSTTARVQSRFEFVEIGRGMCSTVFDIACLTEQPSNKVRLHMLCDKSYSYRGSLVVSPTPSRTGMYE